MFGYIGSFVEAPYLYCRQFPSGSRAVGFVAEYLGFVEINN